MISVSDSKRFEENENFIKLQTIRKKHTKKWGTKNSTKMWQARTFCTQPGRPDFFCTQFEEKNKGFRKIKS